MRDVLKKIDELNIVPEPEKRTNGFLINKLIDYSVFGMSVKI